MRKSMALAAKVEIAVNSAAIMNPWLISEAADKFGSQCVVVAIDAKRTQEGNFQN